jgi:TatD DNase family protein
MKARPSLEPEAASSEDAPSTEGAPATLAVDTHCHLFLIERETRAVLDEARAAGVGSVVCVGIDLETSRRSIELAQSYRGVFATAGVHPHTASDFDRGAGSTIEELAGDPLVVGIGETGLDYFRRLSPEEDQHRAFRTHIALSRETGKPLVVHVRDAWDDAFRILDEEGAERVVLHCFSGGPDLAREACARGYVVSFAANITYPNAGTIREAAGATLPDHVVVETDSPFLPPQTLRGTHNAPANLPQVLRALADAQGLSLERMVEVSAGNARRAFPQVR